MCQLIISAIKITVMVYTKYIKVSDDLRKPQAYIQARICIYIISYVLWYPYNN